MTARLDIVTNDAGENVRRERARELGAGVVVSIYRMLRLAQMHDLSNQAFLAQLEESHRLVSEYCLNAGMALNVLFAKKAVFVAGQLLKGSRATYDQASELGDILEWCGGAELAIQRDVTVDELRAFAEAVRVATASEKGKAFRAPSPRIRVRAVTEAARLRGLELEDLSFEDRVIRSYASAVVVMRRFFEELKTGTPALPKRVKRIAQTLVDLSEGTTPTFLGVTEARNANHDEAGRAVNGAILAVAIARELTDDRAILAQVAMAALVHDVGRPRALALAYPEGMPGTTVPRLPEDAEDALPAGTAAVLTALGRVNEPTITRTVIAYEAQWLRRAGNLGPIYHGVRTSTLQARVVAIARRYNELVTPEPGLDPPAPHFVVATLSSELREPSDHTILRALVAALGIYPIGTVVQLTTGEVAEVVSGDRRGAPERPRVRVVMDAHGGVASGQGTIDLGASAETRRIAKVLGVDAWKKGLEVPHTRPADQLPTDAYPALARPQGADAVPPARGSTGAVSPTRPSDNPGTDPPASWEHDSVLSVGTSPSAVAGALERFMLPQSSSVERPVPGIAGDGRDTAARGRLAFSIPPTARGKDPLKDRTPTAKGTLGATPLVHILVYMLDHALSGTVSLREPDGAESLVYFLEGAPAKVRTAHPVALLGQSVLAAKLLSAEALDRAVEAASRLGVLLGEYLVGGGVLSIDALGRHLEAQVKNKVASLVNLSPDTTYSFFRDANGLEAWGSEQLTPCHPLDAVLECSRRWHDRARIHATLSRIAKQPLVLHQEVDLSPVALTAEEEVTLAVLRVETLTLQDLRHRRVADEETIGSLVYMLAVTRQFAFPNQKGGPMGGAGARSSDYGSDRVSSLPMSAIVEPSRPSVVPGPHAAGAPSARSAGGRPSVPPAVRPSVVPPVAVHRSSLPPPRAPDVRPSRPPRGSPEALVAGSAVTWRPPSRNGARSSSVLPPPPPSAAPPARASVLPVPTEPVRAAVSAGAEAGPGRAAVLPPEPAAGRPSYAPVAGPEVTGGVDGAAGLDSTEDDAVDVPVDVDVEDESDALAERAIQAMTDFRLAEAAFNRNDLATAERLAARAASADPDPEYVALLAWIRGVAPGGKNVTAAIAELTRVLEDNETNVRALLYRAKLLQMAGRTREALSDYEAILDVNPKHNEATSEARLLRIRAER